jgi:4-carboxymuconolactone decarboxylase
MSGNEPGGGDAYASSLTEDQRSLYETIRQSRRASDPRPFPITDADGELVGPFKQLLLSPLIGAALERLGAELRSPSALAPRGREIAILLIAAHEKSDYEWRIHAHRAQLLGVGQEVLDQLAVADTTALTDELESAIGDLTLHLLRGGRIDAPLLAQFEGELGRVAVFELVVLVGYYRLLAAVSDMRDAADQMDLSADDGDEAPQALSPQS